jgi:hypothetical protein
MRDELRRERRVELAQEGHRYWDLIRWKTAEIVFENINSDNLRKTYNSQRELDKHKSTNNTFHKSYICVTKLITIHCRSYFWVSKLTINHYKCTYVYQNCKYFTANAASVLQNCY